MVVFIPKLKTPIDIALEDLARGVVEATGNNDGLPAELYMDGDELAWCAGAAMNWYARSDWAPLWTDFDPSTFKDHLRRYGMRAVDMLEAHCQDVGIWLGPNYWPQPGDVVFYDWRLDSDNNKKGRHCGLVLHRPPHGGGPMPTVEGNVDNRVAHRIREWPWAHITGFASTRGHPRES